MISIHEVQLETTYSDEYLKVRKHQENINKARKAVASGIIGALSLVDDFFPLLGGNMFIPPNHGDIKLISRVILTIALIDYGLLNLRYTSLDKNITNNIGDVPYLNRAQRRGHDLKSVTWPEHIIALSNNSIRFGAHPNRRLVRLN